MILGIDLFVGKGVAMAAQNILSNGRLTDYTPNNDGALFGLLASMIVLALMGMIVQWRQSEGRSWSTK